MTKTYFKTIEDASEAFKKIHATKDAFNRKETAHALAVSRATLHRFRKDGRITPTLTKFDGTIHVTYTRDEVVLAMFKMGGLG